MESKWTPYFLGIGAARCATTWIGRCIEQHPELYIPESIKEIHFFDNSNEENKGNYKKGIQWYKNYFKKAQEHQKVGEITPNYFNDENAPKLIFNHFPHTKLILSLRNPVERCFSHYQFIKKYHKNISHNFLETIMDKSLPYKLLELGLYSKYLKNYLKYFNKEQILILLYDDIASNPSLVCKKIFSFLEVDQDFIPPIINYKVNTSAPIKSKLIYKSIRGAKQYIKKSDRLRTFIENIGGIKFARLVNKLNRITNSKPKQSIDSKTKILLNEYYIEDIEKLEKLTLINLDKWK